MQQANKKEKRVTKLWSKGSHGVSGKPGGGKTYYGVKLLINVLVTSDYYVVTNFAMRLDELNAYLAKEYPDRDINLLERILILEDDEVYDFWTYRKEGKIELPPRGKERKAWWKAGNKPDTSLIETPVVYFIDEIHNYINSRSWMDVGNDLLFYMSQHRKFGDAIYWVTQSVENVDKQFRSITQDYTYVRNFDKERFSKYVRSLSGFRRDVYLTPFTGTQKAQESIRFTLDEKEAACYDTSGGVGIKGGLGADVGEEHRGISIKWIFAIVILIACGLMYGFYRLTDWGKSKMLGDPEPTPLVDSGPNEEGGTISRMTSAVMGAGSSAFGGSKPQEDREIYEMKSVPSDVLAGLDGVEIINASTVSYTGDVERLEALDKLQAQYMVDILIYRVSDSEAVEKGAGLEIFSSKGPLSVLGEGSSLILESGYVRASLSRLKSNSDSVSSTSLKVVLQDGVPLELSSGLELPVQTTTVSQGVSQSNVEFRQAAFELKVGLTGLKKYMFLDVSQGSSDVVSLVPVGDSEAPVLATSSLSTRVRLRHGQTAVLVSLAEDSSLASRERALFRKRDVVQADSAKYFIFVTPTKLDDFEVLGDVSKIQYKESVKD